jgi:hypothetical protein
MQQRSTVTAASSPLAQQLDEIRRSLACGPKVYNRYLVPKSDVSLAALVERDAVTSELRDGEQRVLETHHDTAGAPRR